MTMRTLAPAKINLCLFLGPTRADGRHELVTVMQPISLFDEVTLRRADGDSDEVICKGVDGPNLAAEAIAAFREVTGWDGRPVHVDIVKGIPVAAGMAGGSADAGAVLRLLATHARCGSERELHEIATQLGADVPAQLRPARFLATGAGERLQLLPDIDPYRVLVLPASEGLSTADVYAQADRMGLPRDASSLGERLASVRAALPELPDELVGNDLEAAAIALRPDISERLELARSAGADHAIVAGSGPTVLGLFRDPEVAEQAALELAGREPPPMYVRTVERGMK